MHLTVGTKNLRSTQRNPSSKLSLVITPKPKRYIAAAIQRIELGTSSYEGVDDILA